MKRVLTLFVTLFPLAAEALEYFPTAANLKARPWFIKMTGSECLYLENIQYSLPWRMGIADTKTRFLKL
ncbi:hypothetical protein ABIB40_000905 [Pedobacter sp. UYP30]|uniref:hypothetical protein n=1 Tax=Pedobacter sp. UYP30 TaxID=1756400 RepID=UPI00339B8210